MGRKRNEIKHRGGGAEKSPPTTHPPPPPPFPGKDTPPQKEGKGEKKKGEKEWGGGGPKGPPPPPPPPSSIPVSEDSSSTPTEVEWGNPTGRGWGTTGLPSSCAALQQMRGSSGGCRRGREGGRGGCCVAFGPFYGRCGVEEGGEAAVVEGSSELLLEEALNPKDGLDVSFVLGKHKGLRGGGDPL